MIRTNKQTEFKDRQIGGENVDRIVVDGRDMRGERQIKWRKRIGGSM